MSGPLGGVGLDGLWEGSHTKGAQSHSSGASGQAWWLPATWQRSLAFAWEVSWIPWCRVAQCPRQNTVPGFVARPELKKQFLEELAGFIKDHHRGRRLGTQRVGTWGLLNCRVLLWALPGIGHGPLQPPDWECIRGGGLGQGFK